MRARARSGRSPRPRTAGGQRRGPARRRGHSGQRPVPRGAGLGSRLLLHPAPLGPGAPRAGALGGARRLRCSAALAVAPSGWALLAPARRARSGERRGGSRAGRRPQRARACSAGSALVVAAVAACCVGRRRAAAGRSPSRLHAPRASSCRAPAADCSSLAVGLVRAALCAAGLPGARRLALAAVGGGASWSLGRGPSARRAPGSAGRARRRSSSTRTLPAEYRVSARPVLWESAVRLFERHPVEGAGPRGVLLAAAEPARRARALAAGRATTREAPTSRPSPRPVRSASSLTLALRCPARARGRGRPLRAGGRSLAAGAEPRSLGFLARSVGRLALVRAGRRAALLPARRPWPRGPPDRGAAPPWPTRLRAGSPLAVYAAAVARRGPGDPGRRRGFPLPSRAWVSTARRSEKAARSTGRSAASRFASPPGETMRLTLAHFTPEGRPVELTAEADGPPRAPRGRSSRARAVAAAPVRPARRAARRPILAVSRAFVPQAARASPRTAASSGWSPCFRRGR